VVERCFWAREGMRRAQVELFAPVGFLGGDFAAELGGRSMAILGDVGDRIHVGQTSGEMGSKMTYPRVAQERGLVLHLNRQLFFFGEIEKGDSLSTHTVEQVLRDPRVFNVQEPHGEDRILELLQKSRLGLLVPRLGEVEDGDLLERHGDSSFFEEKSMLFVVQ